MSYLRDHGVIASATRYLRWMEGYTTGYFRNKADLVEEITNAKFDVFKKLCDNLHCVVATDNVAILFVMTLRNALDTLPFPAPEY